jgi:hypothetical protein
MATKENKRQVRELVEGLERRVHRGPVIQDAEIRSARDFLRQHDFPPASDYFKRLMLLENRLQGRAHAVLASPAKRNYGGEAGGRQMQVQSIYDHLILSTCYAGEFNTQRGRIKISHRFNREGRMDFVELKYLTSLHPPLNGELRKLLTVKDYPSIRKDWYEAEAFVLEVLPRELIFLYEDIFRCPRAQFFAWLLNVGHGMVEDLLNNLKSWANGDSLAPVFDCPADQAPNLDWPPEDRSGNGFEEPSRPSAGCPGQLPLDTLSQDEMARPILEKVTRLESVVEIENPTEVLVRYLRKF